MVSRWELQGGFKLAERVRGKAGGDIQTSPGEREPRARLDPLHGPAGLTPLWGAAAAALLSGIHAKDATRSACGGWLGALGSATEGPYGPTGCAGLSSAFPELHNFQAWMRPQ